MHERPNSGDDNVLLRALSPGDSSLFVSHAKPTLLKLGTSLHEPGDEPDYVYFPQSGVVSLMVVMQDGAMTEAGMIGREGVVGALAGLSRRPPTSRALVSMSGTALRVPITAYRMLMNESVAFRDVILQHEYLLFQQIQQNAACNILHSLEQRFCRWLLQAADRTDGAAISLTQEFQAQVLGVHRGSLNLVTQSLRRNGLISNPRPGWLQVLDRAKLLTCACECYQVTRSAVTVDA